MGYLKIFSLLQLLVLVHHSIAFLVPVSLNLKETGTVRARSCSTLFSTKQVDDKGYLIKEKDWFNGLSTNPGDSLNDPRSVPPEAKEFAEKIKKGAEVTFQESMDIIDAHYTYFEVPFKNGNIVNAANENVGSSKIFSFALMTNMDEDGTLRLFGEHYKNVLDNPEGTDHANIRNFKKVGWTAISFDRGLSIVSNLTAGDNTDDVMNTQVVVEGDSEWDPMADSWIP